MIANPRTIAQTTRLWASNRSMAAAGWVEGTVQFQSRNRGNGSWISRWLLRLTSGSAKRYPLSGLVAYYWTGGTPKSCSIANISESGVYILTDERWMPGTVIPMTLQRVGASGKDPEDWIAVITQVVRAWPAGRGLAFVFTRSSNLFGDEIPPERVADRKALKRFLKRLVAHDGSA
jgi:PilZ domain